MATNELYTYVENIMYLNILSKNLRIQMSQIIGYFLVKNLKISPGEEKSSTNESSLPDLSIVKEEVRPESPSLGKLSQRRPSSRSSSAAASPGTPQAKRQKMSVDMSNPAYLRPFEFGWKRELVWRGTFEHESDRKCDIYYYTPTGRKVRSMREVAENLTTPELTVDDFTFFKEPLGMKYIFLQVFTCAKLTKKCIFILCCLEI